MMKKLPYKAFLLGLHCLPKYPFISIQNLKSHLIHAVVLSMLWLRKINIIAASYLKASCFHALWLIRYDVKADLDQLV